MNLILDNASFLKNNKKIKISRTRDLNLYFKLSFKNGFYIRKDLKNKIFFILSQKELIFSNSLKNLIKHKNLINLDKNIIDTYKKTGFIPPPYTIFKNVFCVEPKFCTDNGAMIANMALRTIEQQVNFPECLNLDATSTNINKKQFRPKK